jgi:hypothetical protein
VQPLQRHIPAATVRYERRPKVPVLLLRQ